MIYFYDYVLELFNNSYFVFVNLMLNIRVVGISFYSVGYLVYI